MHYYIIINPTDYKHCIFDFNIELFYGFKGLGIIFDTKFNFSLRSEVLKNNAIRNLGFVKRTLGSFL